MANDKSRCPTKLSLVNQTHVSASPVKCKEAIAYMSGENQITEFQIKKDGFHIVRWERKAPGEKAFPANYCHAGLDTNKVWLTLEKDCLSGSARLSDRAAIRGVGGNADNRAESRAVDDVASVVNWIKRAEIWLDKVGDKQKAEVEKANAALLDEKDDDLDENLNDVPVFSGEIKVDNKHWHDGGLIKSGKWMDKKIDPQRAKRIRDRVAHLNLLSDQYIEKAKGFAKENDALLSEFYSDLSQETRERARAIESKLELVCLAANS